MENMFEHTSTTTWEFTIQFLEDVTDKFSNNRLIGSGGYGSVYKGVMDNGEEIAVKKLRYIPGLDGKEFENEFNNLMMAQHQNIVRLIGYCYDLGHQHVLHNGKHIFALVEEKFLCFEYLQGGSLDKHISDESRGLDWPTRYKIITGVCDGVNYLHNGLKDPIYHLDLKPANILLDKTMMAKIADFGLSRLFGSTKTCMTNTIIGTCGYMPPEFIKRNQITSKFDVFSFGVIIIQIMAGEDGYSKCADMTSQEFIDLVHGNWEKRLQATMSLQTSQEVKTCIEIALRCVEADRAERPTIAEIVDELKEIGASFATVQSQLELVPEIRKVPYTMKKPPDDEVSLLACMNDGSRDDKGAGDGGEKKKEGAQKDNGKKNKGASDGPENNDDAQKHSGKKDKSAGDSCEKKDGAQKENGKKDKGAGDDHQMKKDGGGDNKKDMFAMASASVAPLRDNPANYHLPFYQSYYPAYLARVQKDNGKKDKGSRDGLQKDGKGDDKKEKSTVPYFPSYHYYLSMFSDENPNSCSIM